MYVHDLEHTIPGLDLICTIQIKHIICNIIYVQYITTTTETAEVSWHLPPDDLSTDK